MEKFINWFVKTLNKDNNFQKLLQWVLLDNNPERMQNLVKNVFSDLFLTTSEIVESFSPRYDRQMLSISIIGLVLYHFQSEEGRKFLPGRKAQHDKPQVISKHIISLLKSGARPMIFR